jgi:hypothetical protein
MTDNNPNPQDTVRIPRPLIEALREALGEGLAPEPREYVETGLRQVLAVAAELVAAVEQAAEGEPRRGVIRHWWPDGRQYIAHADDGICDRCTPPPVSPSKDDKEARIAELEAKQFSRVYKGERISDVYAARDSLAAKVRAGLALADEWEALGRTFAHNSAWYESNLRTVLSDPPADADECASCGEGTPRNECPGSKRPCGHHCNHSWEDSLCHWCGREFGEGGEATRACLCPEPPAAFGPNFIRCREALAGICPSVKPCDPPADAVTLPTTAVAEPNDAERTQE